MKNNKGFGKFEVLTMIVLMLSLVAYLGYTVLNRSDRAKLKTMKDSAISFSRTVSLNLATFHNLDYVYLDEAVEEQLVKRIKSPISSGYCSESQSFVHMENGEPYVTLKCGDYLIDNVNFSGSREDIPYYKVSEWREEKKSDKDEERVLYNCVKNGKEMFDEYYDELYFVYLVNKEFGTEHFFSASITDECKVSSKTFYRTRTALDSNGKAIS